MKALRYTLRALPRDLATREARILAFALATAVAAVTAVGFFTDRVERAMEREASTLLAADLVLESSQPLPDAWRERAADQGLQTVHTVTFPSVLVTDDATELVSVKAVERGYPLRGQIRLADHPRGEAVRVATGPSEGGMWLDPRLFTLLGLSTGEYLPLGDVELAVEAALVHEPDRAGALFQLAPRVMIGLDDLPATGLVSDGSRVEHRLLVAGDEAAVTAFTTWVEARLDEGITLRDVRDARPEMRDTLDRAAAFLGLAAMMAVLLAGAAIAIAVHTFSGREADTCALLRSFGARQHVVITALLARLLLIGAGASLAGVAIGVLAQLGLGTLVGAWFYEALPAPTPRPAITGLLTGLVTLLGFGLVPALRIRRVPVIRVLRRGEAPPEPSALALALLATAAVAVLVFSQAGDTRLGLSVLGGMLGILVLLTVVAWLLVRMVARLRGTGMSPWRFGLANLARRARSSTVQTVGFGLGMLALLLLAVVRVDVLDAWQREIPPDAPNQFMVNIQERDIDSVRTQLQAAGIETSTFYPVIRGRLVRINDDRIRPDDYPPGRTRRLVDREFNMTWTDEPPRGNRIAAGRWWNGKAERSGEWSVEKDIAERLDIGIGDRLVFRVAGEEVAGRVTSLREVDWETFEPNFFVISDPGLLGGQGASWMTAYRVPEGVDDGLGRVVRAHPGITILDVDAIIRQVREVIDRGARAVEYVFLFTLLAGLAVLAAAIGASRDERRAEIALLRTLGARRRRIRIAVIAEFGTLGALAGGIAALGAAATGWAISTQVLELPWHFNPWLLVAGVGGGGAGIALAGLVASRALIREPPLSVLRGE